MNHVLAFSGAMAPAAAIPFPTAKVVCLIETRRYVRSHLKEPRGRGLWLFETAGSPLERPVVVYHYNGPYSHARDAAKAWGSDNGHSVLFTCP